MSNATIDKHDWSSNRPTQIGKYDLSLHPDQRNGQAAVLRAEVRPSPQWFCDEPNSLSVCCDTDVGTLWLGLESSRLDGALWRACVEPADPHKRGD